VPVTKGEKIKKRKKKEGKGGFVKLKENA